MLSNDAPRDQRHRGLVPQLSTDTSSLISRPAIYLSDVGLFCYFSTLSFPRGSCSPQTIMRGAHLALLCWLAVDGGACGV